MEGDMSEFLEKKTQSETELRKELKIWLAIRACKEILDTFSFCEIEKKEFDLLDQLTNLK